MTDTLYCHPVDPMRRVDPTLSMSDLDSNDYIGEDDVEKVQARIEGVTDDFEQKTGHAFRETRVGSPGTDATYEAHGVSFQRYRTGVKVWLQHRDVVPFDRSKGDRLLVRTSRKNWKDLTNDQGTRWNANWEDGWIRIHSGYRYPTRWNRELRDHNVRVCYRYGALGGARERGGQAALSSDAGTSVSTISIDDASRLPPRGLVLVSGSEYVRYSSLDYDANEITDAERGVRATAQASHSSGATVHYVPPSVREAVAARTAVEMVQYDDWVDRLVETGEGVRPSDKIESWEKEYEQALGRHSEATAL